MLLLDTNVVSELRRVAAGRGDANATAWLATAPRPDLHVSVITLLELERGVRRLERRDGEQALLLRSWLDRSVPAVFEGRILPVDEAVARRAAALHVPDMAPAHDALIAATALVHRMTVVTRDVADFARFDGVRVLDPWASAPQGA